MSCMKKKFKQVCMKIEAERAERAVKSESESDDQPSI